MTAVALPTGANAVPMTLHHTTATVTLRGQITHVVVDDNSGSVLVRAGNTHQVRRTESWNLIAPRVTQTVEHHVLTITTRCPNSIPQNSCGVGLVITVPARATSDLTADVGHVAVDSMRGAVAVDAAVGNVRVTDGASRRLTVESAVGDISASLTRAPQAVRLSSPVGDLRLDVPAGTYAVTASSQIGSAKVRGIKQQASSHRQLTARSVTGDVHIEGVPQAR